MVGMRPPFAMLGRNIVVSPEPFKSLFLRLLYRLKNILLQPFLARAIRLKRSIYALFAADSQNANTNHANRFYSHLKMVRWPHNFFQAASLIKSFCMHTSAYIHFNCAFSDNNLFSWKPLKTVHFVVRSDSLYVGGFCLCPHLDCLI